MTYYDVYTCFVNEDGSVEQMFPDEMVVGNWGDGVQWFEVTP